MRLALFVNSWLGWQLTRWLRDQGEEIVALVVHPPERRKFGNEIIAAAGVAPEAIFDGSRLREPEVLAAIAACRPEMGASVLFGYILRAECLKMLPKGCINLHPAFLPYNRGANPNVWAIVDGTPAGVTLHWIDEGVDTGDIIAQERVPVDPLDTGATLYRKLEIASLELFRRLWPQVREGCAPRLPQSREGGTCHRVRDLETIDKIDLDANYTAGSLINILRARTFAPYPGAYFVQEGRRIFLRLQLLGEDQLGEDKE
jgi:methionyl-tRNA formyltransferase